MSPEFASTDWTCLWFAGCWRSARSAAGPEAILATTSLRRRTVALASDDEGWKRLQPEIHFKTLQIFQLKLFAIDVRKGEWWFSKTWTSRGHLKNLFIKIIQNSNYYDIFNWCLWIILKQVLISMNVACQNKNNFSISWISWIRILE